MKALVISPTVLRRHERGIALLTSVMLLVVITLLAVSMFKSFGMQEKLAGNTLEKQRSFQAAQSALQYGEWWLSQGYASTGVPCTSSVDASTVMTNMRVCAAALTNITALPWSGRTDFKPLGMTVAAGGGLAGVDVNYARIPALYISYLGLGPDSVSMLYQVTAAGYGGTGENSASVVQSTYAIKSKASDLGLP